MVIKNMNEAIAVACNFNAMDEAEFAVSGFENGHRVNLPCWQYVKFDLDEIDNDECKAESRFEKDTFIFLQNKYNKLKFGAIDAVCMHIEAIRLSTNLDILTSL